MFVCTGCKKEYDAATKFCSECGGKVISKTATVQPVTVQPATVQPATVQVQPATVQTVQPVTVHTATVQTVQTATVQTAAVQTVTVQPATVKPVPVQPVQVQPATVVAVQPAAVQPATVQPATVQPVTVQPATVKPVPVQPVQVQPATVQPVAVQPAAVQPVQVQPATVQPAAVQPVTVQPAAKIDKKTAKKKMIKSIASIIGMLLALGCAIGVPMMNKYIAKITKENQEAAVQTLKKIQKATSDDDIKKLISPSARDNRKLFENISKLNMIMLSGDKVTFSDCKVKPDKQVAVKVSWSHSGGTGSAAVLVTKEKDQWFISDCTDVKGLFD